MLTDRFAQIQLFHASADSTAAFPQESVASATISFPNMTVLFTEGLKGSDWCCTIACRHKGFSSSVDQSPTPEGGGDRNHCRQCLDSLLISRPASSQGIASKGRNSSISSPGRNPNKDLRVRSHNFTPSCTIQWGFSIRGLVGEGVIRKQWGKKTKLK